MQINSIGQGGIWAIYVLSPPDLVPPPPWSLPLWLMMPWSTAPYPPGSPQSSLGSLFPHPPGHWLWFAFADLSTGGCLCHACCVSFLPSIRPDNDRKPKSGKIHSLTSHMDFVPRPLAELLDMETDEKDHWTQGQHNLHPETHPHKGKMITSRKGTQTES